MGKNIVILFDGTSNEVAADRSNILRLYGTLEKSDRQLVYYDPGVGTFGAEDAWFRYWRKALEIWGLATGWGLDQNVKEAYRFLVENYDNGKNKDKGERDRIYIFGFSRGAYSARVLAGFVHALGLMEQQNLNLLDYAYRAYKRIGETGDTGFEEIRLFERVLATDRPPIRLLGLFDTVASVIEHGRFGPRLRSFAFTSKNSSVETVRHAVSIDEQRTMFQPRLWIEGQEYHGNPFNQAATLPQDAREVWFAGVHSDVGGGYPEKESGLAKVPLNWMIEQTQSTGIHYKASVVSEVVLGTNPGKSYVAPDPDAKAHNSMNWAWALMEFLPQRHRAKTGGKGWKVFFIPLFGGRTVPNNARIHNTVLRRQDGARRSAKLPREYQLEP